MFKLRGLKGLLLPFMLPCALGAEPAGPQRVITLAPSLGEIAADVLGADLSRIIAVSEYTTEPPGLIGKPTIGPYHHFNLEKVKALKPDLVLATYDGNSRDQILHLKQLGMNVVVVETNNLNRVGQSFEVVAGAIGQAEQGKKMKVQFERGIERLKLQGGFLTSAKKARLRVFVQIGDRPIMTVGGGSFMSDALNVIGVENVFADQPAAYPRVSAEEVVKRNPDVILVLGMGKTDKEMQAFNLMASRWRDFPEMDAVKAKRIEVLTSEICDALLRPSLRLLEGMERLQKTLKKWAP